jgi:hypothetical protein
MKKLISYALIVALGGCGDRSNNQTIDPAENAPDAAPLLTLSPVELERAKSRAAGGDIKSAQALLDHFVAVGDRKNAQKWEAWLIEHNDPDILAKRAEDLFREARALPDDDRRKLELLASASDLNHRALQHKDKGPQRVLVNGKEVDISAQQKKGDEEFTAKLETELKRVRSLQQPQ